MAQPESASPDYWYWNGTEEDYLSGQWILVGSMILDPKIVGEVVLEVRPEDFSNESCRAVFQAICALFREGQPLDWPLVKARMSKANAGEILKQVQDLTPTPNNWQLYLQIIRAQARVRALRQKSMELLDTGLTMSIAAPLVAEMETVVNGRELVPMHSMEENLIAFYAGLSETPQYLSWGNAYLDSMLLVEAGDYVLLGGFPSDGKTALSLSWAYHQAKDMPVGYFSLETKPDKLITRLMSSLTGISLERIKRRTLEDQEYFRLAGQIEESRKRQLFLVQASGMTAGEIRNYARARGFRVVYIDYLQLIRDGARDEFQRVTNISMALHEMAQRDGVTVVALSQLSRGERKAKDDGTLPSPTLSSLRSSGQLEQDADAVLLLYRERASYRSVRKLEIVKNKEGELGYTRLNFDGAVQRFTTAPDEPEVPERGRRSRGREDYEQLSTADLEDLPF